MNLEISCVKTIPPTPPTHPWQHVAIAVNDELSLHARLLDDLDEDLGVTQGRMRMAQVRPAAGWAMGIKGWVGGRGRGGIMSMVDHQQ